MQTFFQVIRRIDFLGLGTQSTSSNVATDQQQTNEGIQLNRIQMMFLNPTSPNPHGPYGWFISTNHVQTSSNVATDQQQTDNPPAYDEVSGSPPSYREATGLPPAYSVIYKKEGIPSPPSPPHPETSRRPPAPQPTPRMTPRTSSHSRPRTPHSTPTSRCHNTPTQRPIIHWIFCSCTLNCKTKTFDPCIIIGIILVLLVGSIFLLKNINSQSDDVSDDVMNNTTEINKPLSN